MKTCCLAFAATVAVLAPLSGALAQASAPLPGAAASVPLTGKPETRTLSPTELRDSAPTAGALRPEDSRVAPQVSIPLNKAGQAPAKSMFVPAPRAKTAPSGGIDDAAARCGALADAQARDQCRDKLPR